MIANLKALLWEWRGVWVAAPAIAGVVILLRYFGLLQAWEWAAYDQYMRLRPQPPQENRIVIVGADEADVQAIQKVPFPDSVIAELLLKLVDMEPRAIGLDIYRDIPTEPGHQELVKVFETYDNIVGIEKIVGKTERETIDPPPALKKKDRVGSNDLIVDADNKVRRALLLVEGFSQETIPSFAMFVAALYLAAEGIEIETAEGTDNWWKIGGTVFPRFKANDGGYVRADAGGYQILIDYQGSSGSFETVSVVDILEERVPSDWGKDKIVLIGAVGQSFQDFLFTPYGSGLLSLPEVMPGVEIHANIANQILSVALDGRPLIRTWSEPMEWLWILLWGSIGATLSWQLRHSKAKHRFSIARVLLPVLAIGALLGSTYVAFVANLWIPLVPPLLAAIGSSAAITIYIARTAGDIRRTFGRYLSDEIVSNLLESPQGLQLGGERRRITILTSDLRGFTATSERLPPEKVIEILNFYLGHMADVITSFNGTIDEFMGDGILVLFGAPTAREDDARRAIACAIAMQLAMEPVNEKMREWDLPALEMGIGINTGEVVVGNIGSEKRTKYGIVGSQVNLTYRIESYTTGGQVIISEPTLLEAGGEELVQVVSIKQVQPKGVKEPISIYDIGGIAGEYGLLLKKEEEVFYPLSQSVSLHYTILEGKHVGENLFQGILVEISTKGGSIRSLLGKQEALPLALTNIKINFNDPNDTPEMREDVYAKVIENPAAAGSFYIRFTAKPPAVDMKLKDLYASIQK